MRNRFYYEKTIVLNKPIRFAIHDSQLPSKTPVATVYDLEFAEFIVAAANAANVPPLRGLPD